MASQSDGEAFLSLDLNLTETDRVATRPARVPANRRAAREKIILGMWVMEREER